MTTQIRYDYSKRILMMILIFTCAVFGVFLCVLGFSPASGSDLTQKTNNSVDYSVKLKKNDYFEKDILPAGGKYISNLIDHFDINYKFDTKFSQPVSGVYSYKIVATISADENKNKGSSSYWSRDYELYESDAREIEAVDRISFSHDMQIGYDKYNIILRGFKEQYALSAVGKMKISLVVTGNVNSKIFKSKVPIRSEMSLSVPLTQQALEVSVDTDAKNNEKILASTPKIDETVLLACRVIGLALIAAAILSGIASHYVGRIKEASTEYEINVGKLLSSYDSIIVNLKSAPNVSGLKVSEVDDFDELLDVYNSVHMPINYYSYKNSSTFIIIDDGMAWKFVVRLSDYK